MELSNIALYARTQGENAISTNQTLANSTLTHFGTCHQLQRDQMIISRTNFIVAITICTFVTCASILGFIAMMMREYSRKRESRDAKVWGRKSTYRHRISAMQKEIDDSYSRQYKGYWYNEPENPEMGSDSPVEIMAPERVWEAPAVPAKTVMDKNKRRSKMSIFFDHGRGLWLAKI
ncbi:Hypothetical protein R9X50_00297500 [Acrodontium crateriforme]|uniref:Uncharacterized protein n=1 Tax=Acrodontium crateriforme TaxID=150365 RepID=A0AAQ3M857_9PEZI|nr:Hypothetical protein R9X50_00297500 [Acrodontium crateriforme]